MQSIIALALGLFAASAIAQGTAGLPACAQTCITEKQGGAQGYGNCTSLDVACICTSGSFIADLACCVSTGCDAAGQEQTIQFAQAICGSAGEAGALPTTATCAPGTEPTGTNAPSSSGNATMPMSTESAGQMSTMTTGAAAASTSGVAGMVQVQGAGLVLGLAGLVAAL